MILVTGAGGQLGSDVMKELKRRSIPCVGIRRADLELEDITKIEEYFKTNSVTRVIHCAAYTMVDKAEEEKELCYSANVVITSNIAKVCKSLDIPMMYISTDYVFPGNGTAEYDIDDKKGPLNFYGKTKLEGEYEVTKVLKKYFIVRISWVFGQNGNNFVKTMLKLGKEKDSVNVVADQIGSPTYTPDLSKLLCDMMKTDKYGIYHATNEGYCSWAEFAEEIFKIAGYNTKVNHIKSEEYKVAAERPKNSRLSKKILDIKKFDRLPHWKDAVKRHIENQTIIS